MKYIPQPQNTFVRVRASIGTDIVHMLVPPNTPTEDIVAAAVNSTNLSGDIRVEVLDYEFREKLVADFELRYAGIQVFVSDGEYL